MTANKAHLEVLDLFGDSSVVFFSPSSLCIPFACNSILLVNGKRFLAEEPASYPVLCSTSQNRVLAGCSCDEQHDEWPSFSFFFFFFLTYIYIAVWILNSISCTANVVTAFCSALLQCLLHCNKTVQSKSALSTDLKGLFPHHNTLKGRKWGN